MESNSSVVVLVRVVHGILAFCGCYIHVHLYASVVFHEETSGCRLQLARVQFLVSRNFCIRYAFMANGMKMLIDVKMPEMKETVIALLISNKPKTFSLSSFRLMRYKNNSI